MKGSLKGAKLQPVWFWDPFCPKPQIFLHPVKKDFLPLTAKYFLYAGRSLDPGPAFCLTWNCGWITPQAVSVYHPQYRKPQRATHAFCLSVSPEELPPGHRLYLAYKSRILQIFTGIYLKVGHTAILKASTATHCTFSRRPPASTDPPAWIIRLKQWNFNTWNHLSIGNAIPELWQSRNMGPKTITQTVNPIS